MFVKKISSQTSGLSILIVDDEEPIRFMLEKILSREGYHPIVAVNGKHAHQKIFSGTEIDLIICDLKTPLMNGLELLTELRGAGYKMPFIMLSGNLDKESVVAAKKNGATEVLVKPISPQKLLAIIQNILSQSATPSTEKKEGA